MSLKIYKKNFSVDRILHRFYKYPLFRDISGPKDRRVVTDNRRRKLEVISLLVSTVGGGFFTSV